jgi:hypothetical protein
VRHKQPRRVRLWKRWLELIAFICVVAESLCRPSVVRAAEVEGAFQDDAILKYWPVDAPPRHWDVFDAKGGGNAGTPILSISNETLGEGRFVLWFSKRERQTSRTTNGEEYRYCTSAGRSWIFLDEYLSGKEMGQWTPRPVMSSRILLTVDGGKPVDLMADGTYAGCGSTGQPYLLSSDSFQQYHLQIWGYLTRNPKFKWYWDATVSRPSPMTNHCVHPAQTVEAMKVQEAWWSNFATLNGQENSDGWTMGSSGHLETDGMPDGTEVRDGRTVWHAEGQIPYYLTGSPDGKTVRKCIIKMPDLVLASSSPRD